jgi:aminocarboxymuconate-semialdehyde decarboxylase
MIDVHTHIYLPRYLDLLRSRKVVPRIFSDEEGADERLLILPGEDGDESTKKGRPVGSEYHCPKRKIQFMETHGIKISILSLANPWLDFLEGKEACVIAEQLNQDLQNYCLEYPEKFFGFGVLPTLSPEGCVAELHRIKKLDKLRGAIVREKGFLKVLDWYSWLWKRP